LKEVIEVGFVKGLRCRECGHHYPKEALYVCEFCFGSLEVEYDYEGIGKMLNREVIEEREKNMWRYRELLPLEKEPTDGFNTGFTPLFKAEKLGKKIGIKDLYIKDDTVNHPSLSFKDRVVAVALSRAKELGFSVVACASTGNLANSLAAQSAQAGIKAFIFIPSDLESGKIVSTLVYGANLVAVEGNYDEVNRLCSELATEKKWGFVNINLRPYYSEGSKTFGFEIAEQLGWRVPDHIIVPVAGGSLISKVWKAFKELERLGLIAEVQTRIHAAQAAGCAPVVNAIEEESEVIKPVKPKTIVKSLAIGNPADGYYAVRTVRESGGSGAAVSDEEVIEGIKLLAETEGIFAETAGGVTVAAALRLKEKGIISRKESLVLSITGNGLKTKEVLEGALKPSLRIKPTVSSFEEALKEVSLVG
jgi:threonine synthase